MESAYIITLPLTLRAARPAVWVSERWSRKKPSLSASRMATNETSGKSSPSRSRLMPTRTSNSPSRRSRMISIRSTVSISWCIYRTRTSIFARNAVRSSAIFFVSVVTRTRSFRSTRIWISESKSSICPITGLTLTSGSTRPVGRITCSTVCMAKPFSSLPGVAETYSASCILFRNSSNFRGRLSKALGSRNPYSTSVSFRARSPAYIAPTCGSVTWDSSTISKKSSGKWSSSVQGREPAGRRASTRE